MVHPRGHHGCRVLWWRCSLQWRPTPAPPMPPPATDPRPYGLLCREASSGQPLPHAAGRRAHQPLITWFKSKTPPRSRWERWVLSRGPHGGTHRHEVAEALGLGVGHPELGVAGYPRTRSWSREAAGRKPLASWSVGLLRSGGCCAGKSGGWRAWVGGLSAPLLHLAG